VKIKFCVLLNQSGGGKVTKESLMNGSGDLSLIVGNNITDASHDLIISVGNNIMYLFIVH
jgi:hypothetical protein